MRESILAQYFDGRVPPSTLADALETVRGTNVLREDSNLFCDLSYDREITLSDLMKLGQDFIDGLIDASSVEAVCFFLGGTDHFSWDNTSHDGAIVADLIGDWGSPETAYPITKKNVKMIVRGLGEGVYDTFQLEANRGK